MEILLLCAISLIFLFSFSLSLFFFFQNRGRNRRAGDKSVERQCVTFTGNSRMNPSKMDGYVYTGFRLVIVPWRRQKSRQKITRVGIWKILTRSLWLLCYRKLQFRGNPLKIDLASIHAPIGKVFYYVTTWKCEMKRNISIRSKVGEISFSTFS